MVEMIQGKGHLNVTGKHKTTIEVTKDPEITKRADCIIGVAADKAIVDLSPDFKKHAKNPEATIEVILRVEDLEETITGQGHPDLTFTHETDMVMRKSNYICSRTLMIKADKSSKELNRDIIEKLKDPTQTIEVLIRTKP